MEKVKKVVKKTWRQTSKEKLLKIISRIIPWLTKGSIDKNSVLAIGGVVLALSNIVGPTAIKPEVAAINKGLLDMQQALQISIDTNIVDTDTTITIKFN